MQSLRREHSIEKMAELLNVSRSRYYEYIAGKPSARKLRDKELLEKIGMSFKGSRNNYGASRIHRDLKEQGESVSKKRIARLMKENQLIPKRRKLFKITTKSNFNHIVAPNVLNQDFSAAKPDHKWVSDITYVWTASGWLYVAAVMDLYSRKLIGLSMDKRMTRKLVIDAFNHAITRRGIPENLIYHSDRGSQYTSKEFKEKLISYGITISNSGTGNCYDNAAMESFFATLKTECVFHEQYKTREEAKLSIFDYCEVFYNNQRRHSALGYRTPKQVEEVWFDSSKNVR